MAGISYKEAQVRNDTPEGFEYIYTGILRYSKRLIRKTPIRPFAVALREKVTVLKPSLPKAETMEHDWEQGQGKLNRKLYDRLVPYMTNRSSGVTLEKLGFIDFTDEDVSEKVMTMLEHMKGKS